jgi:hypothetical protein
VTLLDPIVCGPIHGQPRSCLSTAEPQKPDKSAPLKLLTKSERDPTARLVGNGSFVRLL